MQHAKPFHQPAVDRLIGTTGTPFDLCEGRDHRLVWYLFVPTKEHDNSCLKIHGGLPQPSPRIRGAVAWCRRKPGRQATLTPLGRLFLEEAA